MSSPRPACKLRAHATGFNQAQAAHLEATAPGSVMRAAPLPVYSPPALSAVERAANESAIRNLEGFLRRCSYSLSSEEAVALASLDDAGRVRAQLVVNGYPVNEKDPWLNELGSGLAMSMRPHILQLDSLGLLDAKSNFVRLDIHPRHNHARAGQDGELDDELMREMARWSLACTMHTVSAPLASSQTPHQRLPPFACRLILEVQWSRELLVFGLHAREAFKHLQKSPPLKRRDEKYGLLGGLSGSAFEMRTGLMLPSQTLHITLAQTLM